MSASVAKRVLFVDDDPCYTEVLVEAMSYYAKDTWEIRIANNTAKAFKLLNQQAFDLIVTDMNMPVVDGNQFLKLLSRKFPDIPKAALSSETDEKIRTTALANGAELFIQKPGSTEQMEMVFANLNELIEIQESSVGFRGLMRKIGLHDVLQMECLSKNSCILVVTSKKKSGKIFIKEGDVVHAVSGDKKGPSAFNSLLSLVGGEFALKPFEEPGSRTIEGSWEGLLMDAAQNRDEGSEAKEDAAAAQPKPSVWTSGTDVSETLILTPAGDVLYEDNVKNLAERLPVLKMIQDNSRQLNPESNPAPMQRLVLTEGEQRTTILLQSDSIVLVQTRKVAGPAGGDTSARVEGGA